MGKYKVHREYEGWETFKVEADSRREAREIVEEKADSYELDELNKITDALGHTHKQTVAEKMIGVTEG